MTEIKGHIMFSEVKELHVSVNYRFWGKGAATAVGNERPLLAFVFSFSERRRTQAHGGSRTQTRFRRIGVEEFNRERRIYHYIVRRNV